MLGFFKQKKNYNTTQPQQTKALPNKEALLLSAAVVGPAKVGKSVLSKNFAERHNMIYVNINEAAFCNMNADSLLSTYKFYEDQLSQVKSIDNRPSIERRFLAYAKIFKHNYEFRKAFPNVKNFEAMGYAPNIFKELKQLDYICAQMYYKHFENELIKSIITQATVPCIIDMPHTATLQQDKSFLMCVHTSIERFKNSPQSYPKIQEYLEVNNLKIEDLIKIPTENINQMGEIINKVGTVVALQYPEALSIKNKNDISPTLANGKVICSEPTKAITEEFVYKYAKDKCLTFSRTYQVLDETKLNEMMVIMEAFMLDKNENLPSLVKETALSF